MEAGQLYRNGQRVNEPYVVHGDPHRSEDPVQRAKMREWQVPHLAQHDTASYQPDLQDWGPIVVPPDSFFTIVAHHGRVASAQATSQISRTGARSWFRRTRSS